MPLFRPRAVFRPMGVVYHGRLGNSYYQPTVQAGATTTIYQEVINDGAGECLFRLIFTVTGPGYEKVFEVDAGSVSVGSTVRKSLSFVMPYGNTNVQIQLFSEVNVVGGTF